MKWFHGIGLAVAIILCVSIFFPSYSPLYWLSGSTEEDWSFSIEGLVDNQHTVTYKELLRMPATTVEAKLYCYPNNLVPVQEGNWTGVRLSLLLQRAGLSEDTVELAFCASDGFTADISVEDALRPDVIIAYELNGKPIAGKEGYPKNRLVNPGAWGFKWIAWIVRIEAVDYDFHASYPDTESLYGSLIDSIFPGRTEASSISLVLGLDATYALKSSSTFLSKKGFVRFCCFAPQL